MPILGRNLVPRAHIAHRKNDESREKRIANVSQSSLGTLELFPMPRLRPSGISVSAQERFEMRNKLLILAFSALIMAGCSNHQALPANNGGGAVSHGHHVVGPHVRQTGEQPVQWRRFFWGTAQSPYYPSIVTGPDGNMWYDDYSGLQLVRMNMNGGTKRFPLVGFNPTSFTVGNDGKFYLGDVNISTIDVVTTGGVETKITIPSGDKIGYDNMALGPDNNVWFTEYSHVGKITTADVVTEYPYSDNNANNYLGAITVGPDNNMWATEYFSSSVNKITPATGAMTNYPLGCNPTGIVSSHGNLWISCTNNVLNQVTTAGVVTPFYNAFGFPGSGKFLTVGPDGNPWFGTSVGNEVGEFDPTTNQMTYFYPPNIYGTDNGVTSGPDGNLWAVDSTSRAINVYILNVIAVAPSSIIFTAGGQTKTIIVTEPGTTAWTATTNKASVATVAQSSPASKFTVTSVAAGVCKIIVSDAKGNSFAVHVTVQ
jgi:streptogramin lyase